MISDKNMVLRCIRTPGGRLSGIKNMGQQLYALDDIPYGLTPSHVTATLTFPASTASSGLLREEKALQTSYEMEISKNLCGDV